jgi:hypothetical protein
MKITLSLSRNCTVSLSYSAVLIVLACSLYYDAAGISDYIASGVNVELKRDLGGIDNGLIEARYRNFPRLRKSQSIVK